MKHSSKNNISAKLIRTFLAIAITALLISNVAIFLIMQNAYGDALTENYRSIGDNIAAQIDNRLAVIIKLAQTICTDTNVRTLAADIPGQEGYQYYSGQQKLSSQLNAYAMMYDNLVSEIYFMTSDRILISRNAYYQETPEEEWFLEFEDRGVHSGFSKTHQAVVRDYVSESRKVVTYIAGMFSMQGENDPDHFLGWVLINVPCSSLFREADDFGDIIYAVFDRDGDLINSTLSREAEEEGAQEEGGSKPRRDLSPDEENEKLIYRKQLKNCDWIFLLRISSEAVGRSLLLIGVVVFLIILAAIAVTSLIVRYYSLIITQPLGKLTDCMTRFSAGDFQAYADISSGDEVEKIADVYNEMIDNIHRQMEEDVRKEKEKKESEIRVLMAQIKPHFIYNCLNCIIYLARQGKTEDIIMFTRAFISVLQSSIKRRPRELVPLLSEVEYIKDYLTLIGFRYGYLPEFSWEIDERCQDIRIPAMILQPVIENCVFHGFGDQEEPGRIQLTVGPEKEHVKIAVFDNGCGMSKDELERLREIIAKSVSLPGESEHIGLVNVNERLRLCYGDESGLHIESEPGKGTVVWFYANQEKIDQSSLYSS